MLHFATNNSREGAVAAKAKFFEEREDQSEVKARIVSNYFFAWANVIYRTAQNRGGKIAYIDLFAGPGRYKDGSISTPLMDLERAIANEKLRGSLVTVFNDENPDHTKNLEEEIGKLPNIGLMKYKPSVQTGNINSTVADQLATARLVPTFSFIDPFGYKGLSLGLVGGAIKDWGCDCVFFFNYNRINAGISNKIVDTHINVLFGQERADGLRAELPGKPPVLREALILERLADAIKDLGGRYVLPFTFKNANGTRSTHHLIFVSKHVRGNEIMKEIMAKESSTNDDGVPSLEYSPADATMPLLFSLKRSMEELRGSLLSAFAGRTLTMVEIYQQHHVDTPFIKKNYKDALLELERNKVISTSPAARQVGTFADTVKVTFPKAGKKS